MKYRWKLIFDTLKEVNLSEATNINIPPIPFNMQIDMNQDRIRNLRSEESSESITEQGNSINVDYIKIQTILKVSWFDIANKELIEDIRLIDKDVERTGYLIELNDDKTVNKQDIERVRESLRNILITFAAFNQKIEVKGTRKFDLGYAQG